MIKNEKKESSTIAKFFVDKEKQQVIIDWLLNKGYPKEVIELEVSKFISYFTEKNSKTGKARWEGEKYFEIKKRFASWFSRIK